MSWKEIMGPSPWREKLMTAIKSRDPVCLAQLSKHAEKNTVPFDYKLAQSGERQPGEDDQ